MTIDDRALALRGPGRVASTLEELGTPPAVDVQRRGDPLYVTHDNFYQRYVKTVVDRSISAVALVVLLPIFGLVALGVRLTMGTGVFYRQERVGRFGEPFEVVKFRSMRPDRRRPRNPLDPPYTGPERRQTHKSSDDPRHTPFGRFIRATSLDELPQLWNVLKGEMSLIGPRPELRTVVARYEPWQHQRHAVRPGLTGLWQVTRRADGRLMCEDTEVDLEYIRRLSPWVDLTILVRTPIALMARTGS